MDLKESLTGQINFEDQKLLVNGERSVIIPTGWLATLQKEMQDILGMNGAYAVIDKANRAGTEIVIQGFLKQTEGVPLEQRIPMVFPLTVMRGWGSFELVSVQKEPLKVVLKYNNSYLSGTISGADESQCYFMGGLVAIIEGIVRSEKPDANFELTETTCVAKGDSHCTFEIVESEF